MTEFWEDAFSEKELMWGLEPTISAVSTAEFFSKASAKEILIPGIGYGRNAKPFLERGMSVTGIEISETAINFARKELQLPISIYHGSVGNMPYDDKDYDGIFCYGLIYLLGAVGREKLIRDCYKQLKPGGQMVFTVISKKAPMYGEGTELGKDWYERIPNLKMFFYGTESIKREFNPFGLVEFSEVEESSGGDSTLPFYNVICKKSTELTSNSNEVVKQLKAGVAEIIVGGEPNDTEVKAIAEALKHSKSLILRMGGCQIGDSGAKAIGEALKRNTSLKELWLYDSQIGDAGAKAIGEGLKTSDSLTTLCLNGNQIGNIGAEAIGDALARNIPLENLGLSQNQIENVGAEAIAKALVTNSSLTALNINKNKVGDIAARTFGVSLKGNTSLKSLGLQHNLIGEDGAKAIKDALKHNSSLKTLRLNNN